MNVINSKNNKSYKYYSEDELIGHKRKRIDYEDSSSPSILSSERNIISSLQHCVTSSKDTEIQEEEKQHRQKQQNQQSKEICYIDQIPKELFFKIISFIGPASSSLVVLTQINKRYATIMKQVGHSMLERSKTCYKTRLPKIYMNESLLSLCTRHVQCFQFVIEKCNVLKEFLEKDFVQGCFMDAWKRGWIDLDALNEMNSYYMKTETTTTTTMTTQDSGMDLECKQQQQQHHHHHHGIGTTTDPQQQHQQQRRSKVPSTITEIDQAMDIVLDLLGKDNISYFLDHRNDIPIQALHPSLSIHGRKNILEYFTTKMERQILILCGKCGGMVFKYIKMMSLLQSQQQLQQTNQYQQQQHQRVLYNRQNPLVLDSVHQWKDEERLDRARLIMQLVIYRLMLVEKNDMDVPTRDDFISSTSAAVASSSSSTSSSSVSSSNEGNNSTISEDDEVSTISDFDDDGNSNDNYKSVEEEPFYTWLEG